jgi:hypothetical protein
MSSPALRLRPGDQLASAVCATRVVVVKAPAEGSPVIACGGSPMVSATSGPPAPASQGEAVTLIGKRYVDASETLELLCTASGAGELSCDGAPMTVKAAKPLPASD